MPRTLLLSICLSLTLVPSTAPVSAQSPSIPPTCAVSTQIRVPAGQPPRLAGRWRRLPDAPIGHRDGPVVVWTGTELIVWGGAGSDSRVGAAYDPATRHWRTMAKAPIVPDPSIPAIWTGTELLVWGGRMPTADPHAGQSNAAAAYSPTTDTWRRIASPEGASGPVTDLAVWTGTEMLAWGWFDGSSARGARLLAYSPTTDTWRQTGSAPVRPDAPATATMAWTGSELVVVGYPYDVALDDIAARAAAYTPATDTWRDLGTLPMLASGMPDAVPAHDSVLLLNADQWPDDSYRPAPAARDLVFDPTTGCDRVPSAAPWASSTGSPSAWTGHFLMFPGARGLAYDPATDSWLRLPREAGLEQPIVASVTWATDRLLVLGAPYLPDTGRNDPDLRPAYEFVPAR